jgi:organic radical activating enzyme
MSIQDWFNSEPVINFRQQILDHKQNSVCQRCYKEEKLNGISRRVKNNLKSVIFMQAFDDSFEQSPARKHFSPDGLATTLPIDMHIDLGNHCNLACKMCNAESSSKIASQEVKWGIKSSSKFIGQDWTANQLVWDSFKNQLLNISNLSNIHFMGGETLLSDRIEDLVDFLIEHQRFDVGFSFVTNGTFYKPELIKKMSQFKRVGIEISIETCTDHNNYVRQETDTQKVMHNIDRYCQLQNDLVGVTIRPAISALSIGTFWTLLEFVLDRRLVIKPSWCVSPEFLDPKILPSAIRQLYLPNYQKLLDRLSDMNIDQPFNASDPHNCDLIVKQWTQACVAALETPDSVDAEILQSQMVAHCQKWDQVYRMNAKQLYPEFSEMLTKYGYVSNQD